VLNELSACIIARRIFLAFNGDWILASELELLKEAGSLPMARVPVLQADLAGVALTSPDPVKLVKFYEHILQYTGKMSGDQWIGQRDLRWLTVGPGSAKNLAYTALSVPDERSLLQLQDRLTQASIEFSEMPAAVLLGKAITFADPDGNRLIFGVRDAESAIDIDSASPAPARLQHVVFATDAAAAMVRFYCDVIGFAPLDYVKDTDGDLTSAFLNCGADHHSIAIFRAAGKRLDHLCFDVDNWSHIRDWADWFGQHHISLRWGPGRHGPGNNLFFFVNDPDDNWLEFSAELEQVDGTRPLVTWAHEERTLNSWGSAFLRS
tara:strand:- start:1 stop:963 length:963 start_codon:yes stop_codon:yes gene_type:complete